VTVSDHYRPAPPSEILLTNISGKSFYKVVSGDSCGGIVSKYGTFSLPDFYKWNPAVGNTCSGLWLDYYVCVGVTGTPTSKPTTTAAPVPTSNAPGPVQEGIASNCQRYHEVTSGDQCQAIVNKYGTFSLQDFYKWNPAVGNTCSGLWLGYYVCIGVNGTPTSKPTTTAAPQPTSNIPSPTQANVNKSCKKWYKVASGDYCAKIATQFNISLTRFYGLNPDVGSNCGSLWLDYYVCVAN
jgi:LysM repeat protein